MKISKSLLIAISMNAGLVACNSGTPGQGDVVIIESDEKYKGNNDADLEVKTPSGSVIPSKTSEAETTIPKLPSETVVIDKPTVDPSKPADGGMTSGTGTKPNEGFPDQLIKNGKYIIKGLGSRKCLQPEGKSKAGAAAIVQETCNGELSQQFQINSTNGLSYQITNVNSLLSLEVKDGVIANLARVQQNAYTKSSHQLFLIEAHSPGVYLIKPQANPALCVDVSYGSNENGAFIQLWSECNLPNQQWAIIAQ